MEKEKLAMVDMDGTLVDTAEANYLAYRDAMAVYGYSLNYQEYCNRCDGRSYKDFLPLFVNDSGIIEKIHMRKNAIYPEYTKYMNLNHSLVELLDGIRRKYYLALITTASRVSVEMIMSFFQMNHFFDLLVTRDEIEKVKPEPDSFLFAMKYFGVKADHTIVFEDSPTGIEAAKKCGCPIFIYKKTEPENAIFMEGNK